MYIAGFLVLAEHGFWTYFQGHKKNPISKITVRFGHFSTDSMQFCFVYKHGCLASLVFTSDLGSSVTMYCIVLSASCKR